VKARAWLACGGAAAIAALMYWHTRLPGLDLGDTASFQAKATLPLILPRDAYPLYFALAKLSLVFDRGEPAAALNMLSAVTATLAVAAFAWLTWQLTRQAVPALAAGLLLASSYTFWSHAIIAEVYALQVLFIALVVVSAVRWWQRPTLRRLAILHAVYALSFGNHLSMILLAPALFWILWSKGLALPISHNPFGPRGLALAAGMAAAGASPYGWNLWGLWQVSAPRPTPGDLLATFWFDVTKADWRESLIGTVPTPQLGNRAEMYWWDLQQQFGAAGLALAAVGVLVLARSGGRLAGSLFLAYVATVGFAFFYNVGDTHVFLLPSHTIVALAAGLGIAALARMAAPLRPALRAACLLLLVAIPLARIAETWPAVDRSRDRRSDVYVADVLAGLTPQHAVLIADLNWQLGNAVAYHTTVRQPELPHTESTLVMPYLPRLIQRNHALGRDVVLTTPAAERVAETYGAALPLSLDPRVSVPPLSDRLRAEPGTPYVLAFLTPLAFLPVDAQELDEAARRLSGRALPRGRYVVVAGLAGQPPALAHAADRPFRLRARVGTLHLEVRIDAWLPFDTMRRAGFGHAIANRRRVLTLERGVSFVALGGDGEPRRTAYAGGIFAPQPRFWIPVLR
jgi:hypothetical protein